MSVALELYRAAWYDGLSPDPELTVSQWADENVILVDSPIGGRWQTDRTPYLREIQDTLSVSSPIERVVLQKGARIGATSIGRNWIGYVIDHVPAPMLVYQPTREMAQTMSQSLVDAMIETTPILAERVAPARSKDSRNTTFTKRFRGGVLRLRGANAASAFRMIEARFLMLDEVDAYPGDVGGEGDPIALAEKRASTYPGRRKIYMPTTPTTRARSRIEREYLASDQRRYLVRCLRCGHADWIQWVPGGLGGRDGVHHHIQFDPANVSWVALACSAPGCGFLMDEGSKMDLLTAGEWVPQSRGAIRTRGYHLSALYAPPGWETWSDHARAFLKAKDDPSLLKVFVNTVLGETWEERGSSGDTVALYERREEYPADVPRGVGILTAAVDVHDDRLELLVVGYGEREQSWVIAWEQFLGSPTLTEAFVGKTSTSPSLAETGGNEGSVWDQLDDALLRTYRHESGRELRVELTVIDSGGHHTEQVYRFCKARQSRRVFAIKGSGKQGMPFVGRPSTKNQHRAPLYMLCVDTGKEIVMGRLQLRNPGPGFIHLPVDVDREFVEQLGGSEQKQAKWKKGVGWTHEWKKIRRRNEIFDLFVYALAALYIGGRTLLESLPARVAHWNEEPPKPVAEQEKPARPVQRRRGSWVTGWKD